MSTLSSTGAFTAVATDPVLAAAKLAGLLLTASAFCHEDGVHFAQQAVREWEVVADPGYAVLEGSDVVGDFDLVRSLHNANRY